MSATVTKRGQVVAESMPSLTRAALSYLTYFREIALIAPPRSGPAPTP